MSSAFARMKRARPIPTIGRPVHRGSPLDYGPVLLLMPFGFHLAMDTLPSGDHKRRLQVHLGCIRLSPSCPFRLLHTFHSSGQRGCSPRFWIQRSSSERRRDLNPPEQRAAQRTSLVVVATYHGTFTNLKGSQFVDSERKIQKDPGPLGADSVSSVTIHGNHLPRTTKTFARRASNPRLASSPGPPVAPPPPKSATCVMARDPFPRSRPRAAAFSVGETFSEKSRIPSQENPCFLKSGSRRGRWRRAPPSPVRRLQRWRWGLGRIRRFSVSSTPCY